MSQPNIVWLMSDHMVYAHHKDLTGYPQLPTLDRLSAEGISFENAFSVCPLCQPVRASMLTGRYPHRHGMILNDGDVGAPIDHDPNARLISSYLKEAGYRVGYFGKWHNGIERTAQDYGFEGFSMPRYGHPYYTDTYAAYLDELGLPEPAVTLDWSFAEPHRVGETVPLKDFPYPYESPYMLMESSGVLTTPLETHEAFFLAHLASDWLADVASQDAPFFLRFDPWGPHHPFYVAEPYANSINPADLPEYPSFSSTLEHRPINHQELLAYRIREGRSPHWEDWQPILARCHEHSTLVDAAVGRVVDALERLNLLDNTLIIYTTDHGGALGSNGGLVDKGWMMTDETVRIPMAIKWPDKITKGTTTDKFVTNLDLVPTVLQAAGAEMPSPIDGTSLLALSQHPDEVAWREDVMLEHHGHYREHHFQRQLRYANYKYVAHLDDRHELYDLSRDPYELDNLVDAPPMQNVLMDMRQRLYRQMTHHEDNAPSAQRLIGEMGFGLSRKEATHDETILGIHHD